MANKEVTKRPKRGGRQKGSVNKVTKLTRALITELSESMLEQVKEDVAVLDPADRVKVWLELVKFTIPKPQTISLEVASKTEVTIEDRLTALSKGIPIAPPEE